MIGRVKRKITSKISNMLRSAVRSEIENALPIIPQLIEFQNSAKESRQSYYQKDPFPLILTIINYQKLKERLLTLNIPVEEATVATPNIKKIMCDLLYGQPLWKVL